MTERRDDDSEGINKQTAVKRKETEDENEMCVAVSKTVTEKRDSYKRYEETQTAEDKRMSDETEEEKDRCVAVTEMDERDRDKGEEKRKTTEVREISIETGGETEKCVAVTETAAVEWMSYKRGRDRIEEGMKTVEERQMSHKTERKREECVAVAETVTKERTIEESDRDIDENERGDEERIRERKTDAQHMMSKETQKEGTGDRNEVTQRVKRRSETNNYTKRDNYTK